MYIEVYMQELLQRAIYACILILQGDPIFKCNPIDVLKPIYLL